MPLEGLDMLVLTRKVGEEIVITVGGKRVTTTVLSVDRGRVRLGIVASPEVKVHRGEIQARIDSGDEVDRNMLEEVP
jgi:carbon storage regulator